MKRKQRYLKKVEMLEKEVEFLKNCEIMDETTKRAVFYSLEVCIEILMDLCAMKVKDSGLVVEDDYTNIEKLQEEEIITGDDAEILKQYNGMRNIIVHRYNKINLSIIKRGIESIDRLMKIGLKMSK